MAKSRSDKMDVDKPTKKEKKFSDGRVTKHERKDKKSKKAEKLEHQTTSDSSEDESSKESADEGGAPLGEYQAGRASIENFESKLARKQRRKEARLREEALKILMEKEWGPSPTASNLHVQAEQARRKQKKAERKKEKQAEKLAKERQLAEAMAATAPMTDEGGDIFMIDVNPTPVDLNKLKPPSDDEDEDMEDGGAPLQNKMAGYTAPPSGMNRTVRRRLKLIEREKAEIQKGLGVPEGSNDKADQVKQLLDEWIQAFDEKSAAREAKKKDRKMRAAARLRSRRGKLLTGEKLKEKGKLFSRRERQGSRPAISRNN